MARILQVGAGSGGIVVLDAIARDPRVHRIDLIEPDIYSSHNVHRHLFPMSAVGRLKAEVAKEWLLERRPDLSVSPLVADITDPMRRDDFERLAEQCDIGICAADNEAAKFAFDSLMRSAGKPWTLGEVLSGGIGGWVHAFTPDGACYGCVASHLQRTVVEEPATPAPDYSDPNAAIREARVPASKAAIGAIANLHANITLEMLQDPSPQPPPRNGEGEQDPSPEAAPFKAPPRFGEGLGRGSWVSLHSCSRWPACPASSTKRIAAIGSAFRNRNRVCSVPRSRLRHRGRISMPPSIGRWLDWVMTDVLPLNRNRPRGSAIQVRYEKAGQWLAAAPVPWNADAIQIEVSLRLTPAARQRAYFALRLPGGESIAPDTLCCDIGDRYRLTFPLAVPAASCAATLYWKDHAIATVSIPMLTAAEFLSELNATLPTVFVKLGNQFVAANAFVAEQCNGLAASLVLRSPVPLAPLTELGLVATFRNERTGLEHRVPVSLSGSQLAACEATATAALPRVRRGSGTWSVAWHAGDRELARQSIRVLTAKRFERSLRVVDSRFLVADKRGPSRLVKQLSQTDRGAFAPAFLLVSTEPGLAAIAKLQFQATGPHVDVPPVNADTLVTDGITLVTPKGMDASTMRGVTGFELRMKNRVWGFVSLSPVPAARITSEGGFKPPPDFVWSGVADEELIERLNQLMNGG